MPRPFYRRPSACPSRVDRASARSRSSSDARTRRQFVPATWTARRPAGSVRFAEAVVGRWAWRRLRARSRGRRPGSSRRGRPRSSASGRWSALGSSPCSARRRRSGVGRLAVVPPRGRDRGTAGLLVRQARGPLSVGGRSARVRQPGVRRRPRHRRHRLADLRRERHRHGDGRDFLRELRHGDVRKRRSAWEKVFAVALVLVMTALNVAGSTLVARVQSLIVFVVVGIWASSPS